MTELELQHELAVIGHYQSLIENSESLEELRGVRDQAEALQILVKSAAMGLEIQNRVAEIRLRAERRAGSLLAHLRLHGGNRRSSSHAENLNLAKMGIDHNRSHRWQVLAAVPEDIFGQYLRECSILGREITAAALLRFAHQRKSTHDGQAAVCGDYGKLLKELRKLVERGSAFGCICVYPPWPSARARGRKQPCPRSAFFLRLLRQLPIADLAAEDSHLHWACDSERLADSIHVLERWGFAYRSILVCTRAVPAYGDYWRTAQDFVILGTRGRRTFTNNGCNSLLEADPNTLTGRESIHRHLERVSFGPFLEIFDGWGDGRGVVVKR